MVEAAFYTALTPLLPTIQSSLALSKGEVGLLAGMYAVGLCVASIPLGLLASRIGVKESALTGLVLLSAFSVAFGFADQYWELLVTRFMQGVAGAQCWASGMAWLIELVPRKNRGEIVGISSGAAALGAVLGPALGGLAALIGRAPAFSAVAGLGAVLAWIAGPLPTPSNLKRRPTTRLRQRTGLLRLLRGAWLAGLPGFLLGSISVLGPLALHRAGWGPLAISAVYIMTATVSILVRPIFGRWSDEHGYRYSLRILLVAAMGLTTIVPFISNRWLLPAVFSLTVFTYGLFWGPAVTLIAGEYERFRIPSALGFSVMNLAGGVGVILGSAANAEIAQAGGDAVAFSLAAAICLAAFVSVRKAPPVLPQGQGAPALNRKDFAPNKSERNAEFANEPRGVFHD